MNKMRREITGGAAVMLGSAFFPGMLAAQKLADNDNLLVLSSFRDGGISSLPGLEWRGFTDQVMGGRSEATMKAAVVDGINCVRMQGQVTKRGGGGFIQLALNLGNRYRGFDGSAYQGVAMTVYGNNEDYNVHLRTGDTGWYDQSYRATVFIPEGWSTIRIPFADFMPNDIDVPLNTADLRRVALLGWMRDFEADVSLAEISLYGEGWAQA